MAVTTAALDGTRVAMTTWGLEQPASINAPNERVLRREIDIGGSEWLRPIGSRERESSLRTDQ
jgi:hypothetical protein